jgi:hypothetical protein
VTEVRIHHPRWDRTLTVPAELWPGRLAGKGWELLDGPAIPAAVEVEETAQVVEAEVPVDEKSRLRGLLAAHSVKVDRRWGLKRLRTEAANLDAAEPSDAPTDGPPTCSVCGAPAVYEIEGAPDEKGNFACGQHRIMWPLSEARPLSTDPATT